MPDNGLLDGVACFKIKKNFVMFELGEDLIFLKANVYINFWKLIFKF